MNKTVFKLLSAIFASFITITGYFLLQNLSGSTANVSTAVSIGLFAFVICILLCTPTISQRLKHICCDLDWAEVTSNFYHDIPKVYRKSFWLLFGFINLAFLFHTINFMWGAGDWAAVRSSVNIDESIQDGRFTAYWLQSILFDGKILPVANNLWTFAGLSLAGVLLSVYWNLPKKTSTIVIIGLFFAVTPYTLSWLYSAKNTLGSLWLPALSLGALLLADIKAKSTNRSYFYNLVSVLLFLFVLGSFFPIINFIAVAVLGRVLLKIVYKNISLKEAFLKSCQSLANFTAALMFYILILFLLQESGSLAKSIAIAPITYYLTKIPTIISVMFGQFITTAPFIDIAYKSLFIIIVIMALFTIIFRAPNTSASIKGLILVPLILIAGKLSFIFSLDSVYQAEYVDFYTLPISCALMLSVLLLLSKEYMKRITYILAVLLIFMGFVRVTYAQKVWKFGWDAETKLAERIITRLEKQPNFDINRQYKLLQIGEVSLRPKYYQKKTNEQASNWLLNKAYYPEGAAKDAYNFYYQTDFLEDDALREAAFLPAIKQYLLTKARPWPAAESIWINGEYIVLILDNRALVSLQNDLAKTSN